MNELVRFRVNESRSIRRARQFAVWLRLTGFYEAANEVVAINKRYDCSQCRDDLFDGGEFSCPACEQAHERAIAEVLSKHGFTEESFLAHARCAVTEKWVYDNLR